MVNFKMDGLRARRSAMVVVAGAALSLAGMAHGQAVYTWNNTGTVITPAPWNLTLTNWNDGTAQWVNGSEAQFLGALTAARYASASNTTTAAGIRMLNTGSATSSTAFYTLSGTITLANAFGDDFLNIGSGSLGIASSTVGGGNIFSAALRFSSNLTIDNNAVFGLNSLTLNGTVSRLTTGGSITVTGQGNMNIQGVINSTITGGIVKSGVGTLHLLGTTTNTFTGNLTVNGGVLSTGSDTALGNAANDITINTGGTFRVFGSSGASNMNLGASRVITVAGNGGLDFGTNQTFNSSTMTLGTAGQLTGNGSLLLSVTGGSTGGLTLAAPQTTYTGAMTVGTPGAQLVGHTLSPRVFSSANGTTLTIGTTTAAGGSLQNASSISLSNGAALTMNQPATTAATTGRLGTVPLTFNSGRFQYTTGTNAGAGITETMGDVGASGVMTITGSAAAGASTGTTLNFGSLTRTDNAMMLFRAPATGTGSIGGAPGVGERIFFSNLTPDTTSGGTTRSVVPWAGNATSVSSTDPQNFMTYDANGFRPLNTATEVVSLGALDTLSGVASGANVRSTSAGATQTVNAGGQAINSYASNALQTLSSAAAGDVLTVNSGAIAMSQELDCFDLMLSTPNGAYVHLGAPMVFAGTSAWSGAGGLAVGSLGAGTNYQLNFSNSGPNTFTGGLFVQGNAGVTFTENNQLGNNGGGLAAGDVTLGGGQLMYNPILAATASLSDAGNNRSITVNASNGTIGTSIPDAVLRIPGQISGSGQMQFGGAAYSSATGIVELTNPAANTYGGGTLISQGILRISNPNQLGTGTVFLNGGTLQASANLAFAAAPTVVASSTIDTQGNSISLPGLNGSGGVGTGGGASQALTFMLTKNGAGTLTVNGSSTYAGSITVAGGTLQVDGVLGTFSTNSITVNAGATLGGSGTINSPVKILAGGTLAPGNSPAILDTGYLTLSSTAVLAIEIDGPTAGDGMGFHDQVNVTGTVTLGGSTLLLSSLPNYFSSFSNSDLLFIIKNDGTDAIVGAFDGLPTSGSTVAWDTVWSAQISYVGNSATGAISGGNDVVLYNIIPAPGAASLLAIGGLLAIRRRR